MFKTPLFQNPLIFYWVFIEFLQSTSNLVDLEKNDQLHSLKFSEVIDLEKYGYLNARKLPC